MLDNCLCMYSTGQYNSDASFYIHFTNYVLLDLSSISTTLTTLELKKKKSKVNLCEIDCRPRHFSLNTLNYSRIIENFFGVHSYLLGSMMFKFMSEHLYKRVKIVCGRSCRSPEYFLIDLIFQSI